VTWEEFLAEADAWDLEVLLRAAMGVTGEVMTAWEPTDPFPVDELALEINQAVGAGERDMPIGYGVRLPPPGPGEGPEEICRQLHRLVRLGSDRAFTEIDHAPGPRAIALAEVVDHLERARQLLETRYR
jgi:hypothetical protein